jgi:glc operon protein GlcG
MINRPALTRQDAAAILAAAEAEALKNQWNVSIAVCDDGGHLLALARLDGANLASAEISQAKAKTAALMRRETKGVEDMINNGRYAFLSAPKLEGLLEGGVPIMVGNQCVGAVGVSGVQSPQDAQIARAGVAVVPTA